MLFPGFRMKSRGFTLFTALVSFLLIALSMLLVQGMTRTEASTQQTLSDIREQAEMEAVADLARADSLQVFNYGLRYSMENFFTGATNWYPFTPELAGNWAKTQQNFAYTYFGACAPTEPNCQSRQFSERLTKHLLSVLSHRTDFGNYRISVEAKEAELRDAVQAMLQESTQEDEFFEIVSCGTGQFSSCTGSFYINLNTAGIPASQYENLPMITVTNTATGRTLQKPVLPRGNLRLYMPLRIFKAIAGADAVAEALYNQSFRNEIESISGADSEVTLKAKDEITDKITGIASTLDSDGMAIVLGETRVDVTPTGTDSSYKVGSIDVTIVFQEKNPAYMVNDTHADSGRQKYRVRIIDNSYGGS